MHGDINRVAEVLFNRSHLCTILGLERSQAIGRSVLMDRDRRRNRLARTGALDRYGLGEGNWTRRPASS